MPTLQQIAQEKDFAVNMTSLMNIMKGIANKAFIDMKKAKESRFEKFVNAFSSTFRVVDLSKVKHPFIQGEPGITGIVLLTSDLSFMGGLNSRIIKKGMELAGDSECEFMVTGAKGMGKIKAQGKPFKQFPAMVEKNMYSLSIEIKDYIIQQCKKKKMSKATAIYAFPSSFISQEIRVVPLLPAHDLYDQALNADADPDDKIAVESTPEHLMEYLADIWITHKIYEMFEDNKMSEYASQSVTLEGSLDNLKDLNKRLKLMFVKSRREVIDTSLREVVASMLCIK